MIVLNSPLLFNTGVAPFAPQTNAQRKFNINAQVVLKACSKVGMLAHQWQPTSDAARDAADIAPRSFPTARPLRVVTVTMLAALPQSGRPSEAYTFTVTATFDGYPKNKASATLFR